MASEGYIVSLDFGTSSMKASLFGSDGELICTAARDYEVVRPNPGWEEVPASRWWEAAADGCRYLLDRSGVEPKRILAVSACALMEAALPVDREGAALRPAILWTDNRNAAASPRLAELLRDPMVAASAIPRILWIKEHEPDIFKSTYKFIQCKDYVAAQLCGYIGTDPTDAWGTGSYDVLTARWVWEGFDLAGIPRDKIPDIHPSFEVVGKVNASACAATGIPEGVPVVAVGGDAFCAPLGAGVLDPSQGYINLGTSAQVMSFMDTARIREMARSLAGVVVTPHVDADRLCLGGRAMSAGHSYAWVRRVLGQREQEIARELDVDPYEVLNLVISSAPETSPPLVCLPQLLGRNENTEMGGVILGLRLNHSRADLMRCVLEGVAMELGYILEGLERVSGQVREVRLIGGGATGRMWAQIIADVLGKELVVPHTIRTATSFGCALGAAIGIGLYSGVADTARLVRIVRSHQPDGRAHERYARVFSVYKKVYAMISEVATELYRVSEACK